eukprot:9608876-Lingulodinium_polyedra.AAC.1
MCPVAQLSSCQDVDVSGCQCVGVLCGGFVDALRFESTRWLLLGSVEVMSGRSLVLRRVVYEALFGE